MSATHESADSPANAEAGAYTIAVAQRPGYLFVTVSGPNTVETIRRYGADVRDACIRLRQTRVLIVVRLDGPRLSMLDVYKAVAAGSDAAAGLGMRAAYVDVGVDPSFENMQIAEGVAVTRGIAVRTFVDIGAAERWLLDGKDD